MASELLKTKALSARIKEPKVRDFDFGLSLTSVESLIPDLPQPKPQELLDLQEQNRKQRLLQSLQKIGGGLEDSSLDFIRRQNFANQGLAKPKRGLVDEPGSYAGKPGYVKPLSPENAKLFEITNPGEVWGEGRFAGTEGNQTRGNWINDADRKRKILKQTKNLITEEEYAKILSDELGQEIKPKKVEGKFGNKQKTQFGEISAKDFKGTYGSIKGGKTQGGSFKYYKPPTKSQIKAYKGALRQSDFNRLKPATVQAVLDLHKNYEQIYRKGNLPIIEDVVSKLSLSPGRAGRATVRLAQVYNGHQFKNPEFQDIRKNTSAANKIFAKMEAAPFGDVYRQGVYEAALETIDAKLGNEVGTFASFKSKARKLLNDKGITQKGFNFNEIAGVTGSSRSGAEFSQFVDIMEKNLNQKTLANLQGQLSTARQKIVKDPTKFAEEAKKFNLKASVLEEKYNIELPKLIKPEDVKSSYGVKRLKELKEQGLDLVKAANRDSYGIKVPKGALTAKEFNDPNNKKVRELIALVGCPDFKGNQAFAEGGRIGFSEGADCFNKGKKVINDGKIAKGAQSRNFAKFANKAMEIGKQSGRGLRTFAKIGILPEMIIIGADTAIRAGMGDTFDEAFKRATDFYRTDDAYEQADASELRRRVGPADAEIILNLRKFNNEKSKLDSLQQEKEADLALVGNDFAETNSGMTYEEIENFHNPRIKKQENNLFNASISDAEERAGLAKETEFADKKGVDYKKSPVGIYLDYLGEKPGIKQALSLFDTGTVQEPDVSAQALDNYVPDELKKIRQKYGPKVTLDLIKRFEAQQTYPEGTVRNKNLQDEERKLLFEAAKNDPALAELYFGPSMTFAGDPIDQTDKSNRYAQGGRINFGSGSGPMPVRIIYIIMDRLRNLKNSTFSNYNQVRMYGEQKGITELLEPFKNIPNKNRITSAIDDAEELKKVMPDEYKSFLDEIIDDTKQFKFKTAHDKQQALEKALPKELKFENLPEKMFPMPNPENPNFIVPYGYPDKNPFQKSRNLTRTEADKFTGKGTRKTYDTFNEKTKTISRTKQKHFNK